MKYQVVIVGGGTGGITVAAQLLQTKQFENIAIIEPSSVHYYQPLWTLVGGGVFPREKSCKKESEVIPNGVHWIKDSVTKFHPEDNSVETASLQKIHYEYLIVSPGMEIFWDRIKGLRETIGNEGVCSNYSYETVESTWRQMEQFTGGRAIFTFPNTPIKCGGAPQKIMYLFEDYLRREGRRESADIWFVSAGQAIFAVKKYADALNRIIEKRGIKTLFGHNLIEIHSDTKTAVFENMATKEKLSMPYSYMHVTPPMGSPQFIRESRLANADGWVSVDKETLQHTEFKNVFALGDASSLPTSKTGAAIRKQAPVLVSNLLAYKNHEPSKAQYDGYTSCPLVTGYGKLILAEFDYNGNPKETFPFDQSKERYSMYLLKKYILPLFYWKGMLKGRG